MSLDLFCASITMRNYYYNTFRLNNSGYGLAGNEDGTVGIERGRGSKIECRY